MVDPGFGSAVISWPVNKLLDELLRALKDTVKLPKYCGQLNVYVVRIKALVSAALQASSSTSAALPQGNGDIEVKEWLQEVKVVLEEAILLVAKCGALPAGKLNSVKHCTKRLKLSRRIQSVTGRLKEVASTEATWACLVKQTAIQDSVAAQGYLVDKILNGTEDHQILLKEVREFLDKRKAGNGMEDPEAVEHLVEEFHKIELQVSEINQDLVHEIPKLRTEVKQTREVVSYISSETNQISCTTNQNLDISTQTRDIIFQDHVLTTQIRDIMIRDVLVALADFGILQKQTKDGVCKLVNAIILGSRADSKALNMLLAAGAGQDRKMDVDTDIALPSSSESPIHVNGLDHVEGKNAEGWLPSQSTSSDELAKEGGNMAIAAGAEGPAPVCEDPKLRALLAELVSPSPTLVSLPLVEAFLQLFQKDVGHSKAELELRLSLMTAIGKCSTLKSIQLDPLKRRHYRMTWVEARALLVGLSSNEVLECLDLSGYHGFGNGAACEALAATLRSSRTLQDLNMACTGLAADGLGQIAAALRHNGNTVLRTLTLDENTVAGRRAEKYLADIQTSSPALQVMSYWELWSPEQEEMTMQPFRSRIARVYGEIASSSVWAAAKVLNMLPRLPFRQGETSQFVERIVEAANTSVEQGKRRGLAVIVSIENGRPGGELDRGRLEALLQALKFETDIVVNNSVDIKAGLRALAEYRELADDDCFLYCINAHGGIDEDGKQYIYLSEAKKEKLDVSDDILKPISECRYLANKPKVFIINVCRGTGSLVTNRVAEDSSDIEENKVVKRRTGEVRPLLSVSDCLVILSTSHGEASFRDTENGSNFVIALMETMARNSQTDDVLSIMTSLTGKVKEMAVSHQTEGGNLNDKKYQCPELYSTLTRKLYWS